MPDRWCRVHFVFVALGTLCILMPAIRHQDSFRAGSVQNTYGLVVASSVQGAPEEGAQTHVMRFFIDPALRSDLDTTEVARRLERYVADINAIFGKNTNRQFEFDAQSGLSFALDPPQTNWCCADGGPLPESGFEVWVHAVLTDLPEYGTYGGFMSVDSSGAAVAAGLRWAAVWDAGSLEDGSDELGDYWRQIDHIVHEMAHAFGAGISEYYSLSHVADSTGVAPLRGIDLSQYPDDRFWSERSSYLTDPLLLNAWNHPAVGSPTSYRALMDTVRFSELTAAICSISMRNAVTRDAHMPDLSRNRTLAIDASTGDAIQDVRYRVWSVRSSPPYVCSLMIDTTVVGGDLVFDWGIASPFNNWDHLRLVKVSADGYESTAQYVSVFDAQEAYILRGEEEMGIRVELEPTVAANSDVIPAKTEPGSTLGWNHPNPFNPTTSITYTVAAPGRVSLRVYDVRGALVAVLRDERHEAGRYVAQWRGTDASGRAVASGVYFYRMTAPGYTASHKMVLVK